MSTIEQIPQLPILSERSWSFYLFDSLLAAGGALPITGIIDVFHLYPTIPNISVVYLLLILVLASARGRYAALVAAAVAFLSFDFFLVPPLYSFSISRWEEWLALFVFLVTAVITSQRCVLFPSRRGTISWEYSACGLNGGCHGLRADNGCRKNAIC